MTRTSKRDVKIPGGASFHGWGSSCSTRRVVVCPASARQRIGKGTLTSGAQREAGAGDTVAHGALHSGALNTGMALRCEFQPEAPSKAESTKQHIYIPSEDKTRPFPARGGGIFLFFFSLFLYVDMMDLRFVDIFSMDIFGAVSRSYLQDLRSFVK